MLPVHPIAQIADVVASLGLQVCLVRFAHILKSDCTVEAVDIHIERHGSSFSRDMYMTVGAQDQLLMGADLPYWRHDYLDLVPTDTWSGSARPSLRASFAAPLRVVAPSLPRIADT